MRYIYSSYNRYLPSVLFVRFGQSTLPEPICVRFSVVPVIDMSLTGMIPLTLRHDSSHLFNQRALQGRGKMGYSGPRHPSVPGVLVFFFFFFGVAI